MKTLQDYQEKKQSELFANTGSFFAFGNDQFNAAKKEGVKYVDMGAGLICPKDTAKQLNDGLESIYRDSIAQDIAENGKEAIIKRELYNHECFYTGRISDVVDCLSDYEISAQEIKKVFHKEAQSAEL